MTSPYRDENESLRAEIQKLRAQLGTRRNPVWVGLALVALDFGAAMVLRPWLNGGGDAQFWSALLIIVAIAAAAAWSVARR